MTHFMRPRRQIDAEGAHDADHVVTATCNGYGKMCNSYGKMCNGNDSDADHVATATCNGYGKMCNDSVKCVAVM